DDTSWKNVPIEQEKEDEEGDDGDLPVVAEFIDERPDEVKWMEEFRTSNKWKLLGDQKKESEESDRSVTAKSTKSKILLKVTCLFEALTNVHFGFPSSSDATKQKRARHSPDQSPPRRRHDSLDQSPPRRVLRDSPDQSPPRRIRCDSADQSPPRRGRRDSPDPSPPRRGRRGSPDPSPKRHHSDTAHQRWQATSDLSPPQKKTRDSDASPLLSQKRQLPTGGLEKQSNARAPSPRKRQRHDSESDSDSPPPRRSAKTSSDSDLSPPRASRSTHSHCCAAFGLQGPQMLSGGKAGLVSAELLRKEQHELRKQQSSSKHLEVESRHAETVFRDKSGRKRDLKQELLEQPGWFLRQQQQNVEDAAKEMQKPLARYIDDQDLDKMLREQEREGDPMAEFLKKKKAKEKKDTKEKPRYNGPAPPLNRFNIWPGYRWDGVDRSNGFEQKRFARISSKKAVQELAYKWSVEDM
uniref:BUD13 homolog n=1 Tax=Podarcis muralis TaxID=64176 RepID=A0A670K1C6_PODMU